MATTSRGGSHFYLTAAIFIAALLLGGGTRAGFLGDAVLQYLAIVVLLIVAPPVIASHEIRYRRAAVFCGLVALVPLLQLIPLPAGVRGALPGKDWIAEAHALFDKPFPFWPISVTPHATWLAFLSLIPPFAVFFCALHLGYHDRRRLALLLVGFCGVSVFLGLLQISQGTESPLRFFAVTNPYDAVGFFANRNHFAALLYCGTVLCVYWALNLLAGSQALLSKKMLASRAIVPVAASLTLFAIFVMAQAMARSRAGLILSMVALIAVLPLALTDGRERQGLSSIAKTIYAVAAVAFVFSLQYALYRILSRFEADPLRDSRLVFARNTWEAAKAYLPFGSGQGSFLWVYPTFEKQADIVRQFANRAHNDVLEAMLESGVFAILLMAVFAFWFIRTSIRIWSRQDPGIPEADRMLMKAASIIVLLLSLHSFMDYPLRTSALACVGALCCAMMMPARWHSAGHGSDRHHHHHSEHVYDAPATPPATPRGQERAHSGAETKAPTFSQWTPTPRSDPASAPLRQPRPTGRVHQKWEGPVEWPEEWKSGKKPAGSTVPGSAPSLTPAKDTEPDGSES